MSESYGRRTWDREEYAELAKQGERSYQDSLRSSLTDDQLRLLKAKYTDHRSLMENAMKGLNKKVLATGISSFKKGRQFGFYCELCNLTFKDNLQFIDHLNHKAHQMKFEAIFDEPLINDARDNDDINVEEFDSEYSSLVKQFVRQNQVKEVKKSRPPKKRTQERLDQPVPSLMAQTMGFASFGSAKK